MSAIPEREAEEAAESETPETSPEAQTHAQRARSVPNALPAALPLPLAGEPEGDSPWSPEAVRARAEAALAPVVAFGRRLLDRELDLIHGPPPSIPAMHARHQAAAGHWNGAAFRGARTGWGWLHTAIATVLYALLDAVFSPAGAIIAALFLLALFNWL